MMDKGSKKGRRLSQNGAGYLFAAPGILGFLIFTAAGKPLLQFHEVFRPAQS